MDDFVAHTSRWRGALLILGSLAFVVLGLWMTGAFGEPPNSRRYPASLMIGIGWFSVLFFGASGIAWVKRFFDETAQLYIGPLGVRWSPWSDQLIPWSEITHVTTWRFKGQEVIILHLRNPSHFPGRGLSAMLAGANRKLSGGDISISLTGTDRSYDEAMSAIARFRV